MRQHAAPEVQPPKISQAAVVERCTVLRHVVAEPLPVAFDQARQADQPKRLKRAYTGSPRNVDQPIGLDRDELAVDSE